MIFLFNIYCKTNKFAMATYNYTLDTFISIPGEDKTIKIFDQYGSLKYTFDPMVSYFYYKNNFVYIKVENQNDIVLDFETTDIAILSLTKLNDAKKIIAANASITIDYYTIDELENGWLDHRYYNNTAITNILSNFSNTSHTHVLSGLTDVILSGITNGEVLVYKDGNWVNSSFTFDTSAFTSNYYTIEEFNTSASTVIINWNHMDSLPTTLSGYGITDSYTKGELFTQSQLLSGGSLDNRYYTKFLTYTNTEVDNILTGKSNITHSHNLENLYNVTGGAQEGETLIYSGTTWIPTTFTQAINNNFYTSGQTTELLYGYSVSSHTHDYYSITSHTHAGIYAPSSHTHDDLYYTKNELDTTLTGKSDVGHLHLWSDITNTSHTHNDLYYTKNQIDTTLTGKSNVGHDHDNYYYSKVISNAIYYERPLLYTTAQTDALFTKYYTSAQTNVLFTNSLSGKSDITHNHSLSSLNGISINSPIPNNFLIYSGTEWVNSSVSFDTSIFYSKDDLNNGQLDNRYITLTGSNNISGDLIPSGNGLYSLGSASKQWKSLFVSSSTIYIDGVSVSVANGQLVVGGSIIATTASTSNNYSSTSHTHDDRYFTQTQLLNGILDNNYYTKYLTYSNTEIDDMLASYYTSSQTNELFYNTATTNQLLTNNYNSGKTYTDNSLLTKSDLGHTHMFSGLTGINVTSVQEQDILMYSGGSWKNVTITNTVDLSAYYTSAQTDLILTGKSNIGHLHLWSDITNTSHTHNLNDLVNTAHTHDERYFTQTQLLNGILDNNYYTKYLTYSNTEIDSKFNSYYTSAQTRQIFYTSAQTDNILSSYYDISDVDLLLNDLSIIKSNTGHTHVLSGLTDVTISLIQNNDALIYNGSSWVNIPISTFSTDLSSYYTSSQTNLILTGKSDITHNHTFSALTNTSHTHNWSDLMTTAHTHDFSQSGQTDFHGWEPGGVGILDNRYYTKYLTYSNTEIDDMLKHFYTSSQTNVNFLSSSTTVVDLGGYSSSSIDTLFNSINGSITAHTSLTGSSNPHVTSFYNLTSTAHTHLWTDIVNTSHTHDFYTTGQIDTKLTEYAYYVDLTAHTSATGSSNPHLIAFTDLTNSGHNHDERYFEKSLFLAASPGGGGGALDNRYYTKYLSESTFSTYSYVDGLFSAITFSGSSGLYYTRHQVDVFLSGKSDIDHNHFLSGLTDVNMLSPQQDNILVYSAGTWTNTNLNTIGVDLSGYYTSATTNYLLTLKSDTGHTHNFNTLTNTSHTHNWNELYNTAHTHSYTDLTNTAHTHDDRYYTETEIDNNFYTKTVTYTKTEVNNLLGNYYTSGDTDYLLSTNYYTNTQVDVLLSGLTNSSHTHSLSGLSDVDVTTKIFGDALVYDGSLWVNSAITVDLSNYYTSNDVDIKLANLILNTGATILEELSNVILTVPVAVGEALVYNGSDWVNSSVTIDLSIYYTSAQTITNFLSANTTLFSSSSHTHSLSGLSDVNVSGVTNGQFLQYSAGTWVSVTAAGLIGNFVNKTGDTMSGNLNFSFMTGNTAQTDRILHVTTGGTVTEGEEIIPLYLTDSSLINLMSNEVNWNSSRTFIGVSLSAYTLYDGQKYIDSNYFYEYYNGSLYRTFYANKVHVHDDLYYTKLELTPADPNSTAVLDYRYMRISSLSGFTLTSLADVYDFNPLTLGNNDFLKYNTVSGWTNYSLNLTGIAYKNEVVLSGRTIIGVSGLSGGGNLGSDLQIYHLKTTPIKNTLTPDPYSIVQSLTFDVYGHVASYVTGDYTGYWIRNIDDAGDLIKTGRQSNDYMYWNGQNWTMRPLTTSVVIGLDAAIANIVKKTGQTYQAIDGSIQVGNNLSVLNDFSVNGVGNTYIASSTVNLKSNYLTLNSSSTAPSINYKSGIKIKRYGKLDYYLVHDEGSNVAMSGGTFKIGTLNNLKTVLIGSDTPVINGVGYWVNPVDQPGYFNTTSDLTWATSSTYGTYMFNINGGLIVTGDTYINGLTVGRGGGNLDTNTTFGVSSLISNTLGTYNTSIGYKSQYSNFNGDSNTSIGSYALTNMVSGSSNTTIGNSALYNNIIGSYNIAIGNWSGFYATGFNYELYIDSLNRSNYTCGQTNSIIYGVMNILSSAQTLHFNSNIQVKHDAKFLGNIGVGTDAITGTTIKIVCDNEVGLTLTHEDMGSHDPSIAPIGILVDWSGYSLLYKHGIKTIVTDGLINVGGEFIAGGRVSTLPNGYDIGVAANACNTGLNNVGVYSTAKILNTSYENIGGWFKAQNSLVANYSLWLQDESELTGKYLRCMTDDGKANWSDLILYVTGISDVSITNIQNGEFLTYQDGEWVNNSISGISAYTLLTTFNTHTGATNPHNTTFASLINTAHTHLWSQILNTAHTHDFGLSGTTIRTVHVNSAGTLIVGDELGDLYITATTTITQLENSANWNSNNNGYIGPILSLTEGQRYLNSSYTYEYVNNTIYRSTSFAYTVSSVDNLFVHKTGDTMTGTLTVPTLKLSTITTGSTASNVLVRKTDGTIESVTISYINGSDPSVTWLEPINGIANFSSCNTATTGNRYIALTTASGWTINNIYECNGTSWTATIPLSGYSVVNLSNNSVYIYGVSGWTAGSTGDTPLWGKSGSDIINLNIGKVKTTNDMLIYGLTAGRGTGGSLSNTAFGYQALSALTITGIFPYGYRNTAFGYSSMKSTTIGHSNTSFGWNTLASNTIGICNTVVGAQALVTNSTGSYNIAIGSNAMVFNLIGNENIAIGSDSLTFNISGISNIAMGRWSLYGHVSGNSNIAIGPASLGSNIGGFCNVAIGDASLQLNNGNYNIALGHYAGNYATGSSELFINNQETFSYANDKSNSIIYGVMASAPSNQSLYLNATVYINNKYSLPTTTGVTGYILTSNGTTTYWASGASSIFRFNTNTTTGIEPVAGNNIANSPYAFVAGGVYNTILSPTSGNNSIIGGSGNTISSGYTWTNGVSSITESFNSVIVGGSNNQIIGHRYSGIFAGSNNTIHFDFNSPTHEVIIGGSNNYISSAPYSGIFGGYNNTISSSTWYSSIIGGVSNYITNCSNSVIIGGTGITATVDNTVYVAYLNLAYTPISSASTTSLILTRESDGRVTTTTKSLATVNAFTTLTSGTTTGWNLATSTNAVVTLNGPTTLSISGATNGIYGTIKIIQGNGSGTITLPTPSKVANGGGGSIILSTGVGDIDVLSFVYDGTNYLWNAGYNYN